MNWFWAAFFYLGAAAFAIDQRPATAPWWLCVLVGLWLGTAELVNALEKRKGE
jgi:4-hydroxybenzoate polyprenyltransferase